MGLWVYGFKIADMTKAFKIFLMILILPFATWGQDLALHWDDSVLEKANTAKEVDYLTPEEKKVIQLTNLTRLDGPHFVETILLPYLEGEKHTRYTRSLVRDLKTLKDLELLYPAIELFEIARDHAINSGKRGTTGHQQFEKRYGPMLGAYSEVAENCAYGYENASDILIRLLIDEGIPDLGHRKNLLNPGTNKIGLSIQPHKKYRYNCVMSFGKKSK